MSETQRTQRIFIAVTMATVIAVTTVFMVYAAILSTYTGNIVTVNAPGGQIQYSTDGTTWSSNAFSINNGTAWYARVHMTGAAAQTVSVSFTLEKTSNGTSWTPAEAQTSSITLLLGDNDIYATSGGATSPGYNWGQLTTEAGTYRVKATISG